MATRPVFVPDSSSDAPQVATKDIEFTWHPGLSLAQKQRSVSSLHASATEVGLGRCLEVSTKSLDPIGVQLSAFHLQVELEGERMPVECAFQSSKVFTLGGPFTDLQQMDPWKVKKDPRIRESGPLTAFVLADREFPLKPLTFFYDWLYLSALRQNPHLSEQLAAYDGFTDIEFNPNRRDFKPINCQARSCALALALMEQGMSLDEVSDPSVFRNIAVAASSSTASQEILSLGPLSSMKHHAE